MIKIVIDTKGADKGVDTLLHVYSFKYFFTIAWIF